MSVPVVVLDACVLVPIRSTQILLGLAEAGLFEPVWSDRILDETQRAMGKVGVAQPDAARRIAAMRSFFDDEALIDDFDHLIDQMTCDMEDRHVLAAGVRAEADVLLTYNTKDFPATSTAPHGITVIDPDMFLLDLLATQQATVIDVLAREAGKLRNPAMTIVQFLAAMTPTLPTFANLAAAQLDEADETPAPTAALVQVSAEEALGAFGRVGDATNPAQVALEWWTRLLHAPQSAVDLMDRPQAWNGYAETRVALAGRSLASKVIPAVDAPADVAYMRFVPETAAPAMVFAPFPTSAILLTLVRDGDGCWRVRTLGSRLSPASHILDL